MRTLNIMGIFLKCMVIASLICLVLSILFKEFSWTFFVPVVLTITLIKLHLRKGVYLAYAKQLYLERPGVFNETETKFLFQAAPIFVEIYRPTPKHIKLEAGSAVGYVQIVGIIYFLIMIFKGFWLESGWSILTVIYMYYGSNIAYSFPSGNHDQDRLRVEKLVKEPLYQKGIDLFNTITNKLLKP